MRAVAPGAFGPGLLLAVAGRPVRGARPRAAYRATLAWLLRALLWWLLLVAGPLPGGRIAQTPRDQRTRVADVAHLPGAGRPATGPPLVPVLLGLMMPVLLANPALVLPRPRLVAGRGPPLAVLADVLGGGTLLRLTPRLLGLLLAEVLLRGALDSGAPGVTGVVAFEGAGDAVLVPLAQPLLLPRVVLALRPLPGVLHQVFRFAQPLVRPVEQPLPDGPDLKVRAHDAEVEKALAQMQARQGVALALEHLHEGQPLEQLHADE